VRGRERKVYGGGAGPIEHYETQLHAWQMGGIGVSWIHTLAKRREQLVLLSMRRTGWLDSSKGLRT
jgi:hypothetical protein